MIPIDHPKLKFPLNLEDRVEFIIKKLESEFGVSPQSLKKKSDSFSKKLNLSIKEDKNGQFNEIKNLPTYNITINNINEIKDKIIDQLTKEGFVYEKSKNIWTLLIG